MNDNHPYELYTTGGGGFVAFEVSGFVALPLFSLGKATLSSVGSEEQLMLFFESTLVTINGCGLRPLTDHLLAGRVKVLRKGCFESCHVKEIHLVDS